MKLVYHRPWFYFILKIRFPGMNWRKILIASNDTIYAGGNFFPCHIEHEKVHLDQQRRIGNFTWWIKYLVSKKFRFEMELPAYKRQLEVTGRTRGWLEQIAENLSGPTYGNMIGKDEALKLL